MVSSDKLPPLLQGSIYGDVEWTIKIVKNKIILNVRQSFYQISFDVDGNSLNRLLRWLDDAFELCQSTYPVHIGIAEERETRKEARRLKRLEQKLKGVNTTMKKSNETPST